MLLIIKSNYHKIKKENYLFLNKNYQISLLFLKNRFLLDIFQAFRMN
jgi:hypothetical protein